MNDGEEQNSRQPHGNSLILREWILGLVFLAAAAWFFWGLQRSELAIPEGATVTAAELSIEPARQLLGEPPQVKINGFLRTCMDCHQLFTSARRVPGMVSQHTHIVLNHGMNDLCLNCHDIFDRDKLVLHNGKTVSFAEAQILCAQCHGTTYRDWQQGSHGKTLGYWDATQGPKRKLMCTQCHDPHSPSFMAMTALPGPNTFRMSRQGRAQGHHDDDERRNPLRMWSTEEKGAPAH